MRGPMRHVSCLRIPYKTPYESCFTQSWLTTIVKDNTVSKGFFLHLVDICILLDFYLALPLKEMWKTKYQSAAPTGSVGVSVPRSVGRPGRGRTGSGERPKRTSLATWTRHILSWAWGDPRNQHHQRLF